uniref:Uncharacterized protein n=1 Tax=Parascaris univalens TaxID=6257 RepID=A0A915C9B6_PARUN
AVMGASSSTRSDGLVETVIWLAALNSLISLVALPIGIYLIVIGAATFLLEMSYIIRLCCGVDGICCRFFGLIINFDGIKRGLLYILFSIVCFLPNFYNNYSIAAGCFIVVTAFLYLMKPLQMKKTPTFIVDSTMQARGNASAQVADPTIYGS